MRAWIGTNCGIPKDINLFSKKPTRWNSRGRFWINLPIAEGDRKLFKKLLIDSVKRLPKHGTKQLLEVEVTMQPISD